MASLQNANMPMLLKQPTPFTMFAAQIIRKSQPVWLPVTLFFLILTIGSGPNSKYWWLQIEAKSYGAINVGALGICDSKGSVALGWSEI